MKLADLHIFEARYTEPAVNKASLKRVYREVQELVGGELDDYESKEDMYILDRMEMFFDGVEKALTKKYGEAEKFNIPEFTVPWFRYTVGDFWIMLKSYSGEAQVEIMPARTREHGVPLISTTSSRLRRGGPERIREAKYSHDVRQVAKQYSTFKQTLENPDNWLDDMEMFVNRWNYLSKDKMAYLILQVEGDDERHAEHRTRFHLEHFNLPFTKIEVQPNYDGGHRHGRKIFNISVYYK